MPENFNEHIEQQLDLLDRFWALDENKAEEWRKNNALPEKNYDFMHSNGFLEENAANMPKDARQKTSGLVDIGLIDEGRRLTNAGRALLDIAKAGDFPTTTFFKSIRTAIFI